MERSSFPCSLFSQAECRCVCGSSELGCSQAGRQPVSPWTERLQPLPLAKLYSVSCSCHCCNRITSQASLRKQDFRERATEKEKLAGCDKASPKRSLGESVSGVPGLCKREQRPQRAHALGQANSIKKVKKQNYPLHRFYSGNNLANVGIIHTSFVHWAKLVGYSEVPGFSSWRILL